MTALVAGLGGAVFAGLFGFIVAWYTNKEADKRAGDERDEREQARSEERIQASKSRALDRGLPIAEQFVHTVTEFQEFMDYMTGDQESIQTLGDFLRRLTVTRNLMALYLPNLPMRHSDRVIYAIQDLAKTLEPGEDGMPMRTERFEDAQQAISHARDMFTSSIQLTLGMVIPANTSEEVLRALRLEDEQPE